MIVYKGSNAKFTCYIANPIWSRAGGTKLPVNIKIQKNRKDNSLDLILSDVNTKNSGMYICTSKKISYIQDSARLAVIGMFNLFLFIN